MHIFALCWGNTQLNRKCVQNTDKNTRTGYQDSILLITHKHLLLYFNVDGSSFLESVLLNHSVSMHCTNAFFAKQNLKKHIHKHIERFQRKFKRTIIWDACSTIFTEFIEFFIRGRMKKKELGKNVGKCKEFAIYMFSLDFSSACALFSIITFLAHNIRLCLSCMFGLMCLASCFIVCLQLNALGKRCRGTRYNRHTLLFIVCSLYLRLLCYLIENWVLQIVNFFKALSS